MKPRGNERKSCWEIWHAARKLDARKRPIAQRSSVPMKETTEIGINNIRTEGAECGMNLGRQESGGPIAAADITIDNSREDVNRSSPDVAQPPVTRRRTRASTSLDSSIEERPKQKERRST